MEFVTPNVKYKQSYIKALKEGYIMGSQPACDEEKIKQIEADFDTYINKKLLKPHNNTPVLRDDGKYYVNSPQITYWLVDKGEFIGAFNLRTELNEFLMYIGGNVGYGITPSHRRKGYATKGLKLLIEKAKEHGLTKLLIAAREDNIGSWKAIEKNGGILENIIKLPWNIKGPNYKRYWIKII